MKHLRSFILVGLVAFAYSASATAERPSAWTTQEIATASATAIAFHWGTEVGVAYRKAKKTDPELTFKRFLTKKKVFKTWFFTKKRMIRLAVSGGVALLANLLFNYMKSGEPLVVVPDLAQAPAPSTTQIPPASTSRPVQPAAVPSIPVINPVLPQVFNAAPAPSSGPALGSVQPPRVPHLSTPAMPSARMHSSASTASAQPRQTQPSAPADAFTPAELAQLTAALTPDKIAWIKTQRVAAAAMAKTHADLNQNFHGYYFSSSAVVPAKALAQEMFAKFAFANDAERGEITEILVNFGATVAWEAAKKAMDPQAGMRAGKQAIMQFITQNSEMVDIKASVLMNVQPGCSIQ